MKASQKFRNKSTCICRVFCGLFALLLLLSLFPVNVKADNEDYGTAAWTYLQFIDEGMGARVSDVSKYSSYANRDRAGEWIVSELKNFGYSNVNTITMDNNGNHVVSYYVRKPGKSQKRIVIGAHYDSVDTKGVEDNGTGISVLLELAQRFMNTETPMTLDFCFFDGEETLGYSGSYSFLEQTGKDDILCYLNLDCLGAGDIMYVYGGDYEDGKLVRDWAYNMARSTGDALGISLSSLPDTIQDPKTPTRPDSSDHYYFNKYGIPYAYFEANRWVKTDGMPALSEKQHMYNSADPGFSQTNGQIIHTKEFEDLKTLESIVPGRVKSHMTSFSKIISTMLRTMDEDSPGKYAVYSPAEQTEAETETESEKTTEEDVNPGGRIETDTEEETTEETTPEETGSETQEETGGETASEAAASSEVKPEEAGSTETVTEGTKTEPTGKTETEEEEPEDKALKRLKILYLAVSIPTVILLILLIIYSFRRRVQR